MLASVALRGHYLGGTGAHAIHIRLRRTKPAGYQVTADFRQTPDAALRAEIEQEETVAKKRTKKAARKPARAATRKSRKAATKSRAAVAKKSRAAATRE